jgi:mannose-1-phosphate guanylyltransferase
MVTKNPHCRKLKINQYDTDESTERKVRSTFDITMENLIDMAVMEASQQLSHVALDLRYREAHSRPI